MEWRELKKNGKIADYLQFIWDTESKMPEWYRNINHAVYKTYEDFVKCVGGLEQVFGLFDGDDLYVVIYIEKTGTPETVDTHVSALRKFPNEEFVRQGAAWRDIMFAQGKKRLLGMMFEKNRPLKKLLAQFGFKDTDLRCSFGESHGKVMRWRMMHILAADHAIPYTERTD